MTDNQIKAVVNRTIAGFQGDLNDLERAVGMLLIGQQYGWRVLLLIHSPSTVRKYTRLLGFENLREILPEVGALANRSDAWRAIDDQKKFWRIVRGQVPGSRNSNAEKRPKSRA